MAVSISTDSRSIPVQRITLNNTSTLVLYGGPYVGLVWGAFTTVFEGFEMMFNGAGNVNVLSTFGPLMVSNTKDTAGNLNLYYNGSGNIEIQNLTGASITLNVWRMP